MAGDTVARARARARPAVRSLSLPGAAAAWGFPPLTAGLPRPSRRSMAGRCGATERADVKFGEREPVGCLVEWGTAALRIRLFVCLGSVSGTRLVGVIPPPSPLRLVDWGCQAP